MADKYELKDMTGSLFKNDKPKKENSPPYTGRIKIEGKEYWMNGFVNEKKDGTKYFGFTFNPCDEKKSDTGTDNDIGKW